MLNDYVLCNFVVIQALYSLKPSKKFLAVKLIVLMLTLWLYSCKKQHLPKSTGQQNTSDGMDCIKKGRH